MSRRRAEVYVHYALIVISRFQGRPDELRLWWTDSEEDRLDAELAPEQEETLAQACRERLALNASALK